MDQEELPMSAQDLTNLLSGISPSHSVDSGFDDSGACIEMPLFRSLEDDVSSFNDLEGFLLDDCLLTPDVSPNDLEGLELRPLSPFSRCSSHLPKVGVPNSKSLSVGLDHCYNLPTPSESLPATSANVLQEGSKDFESDTNGLKCREDDLAGSSRRVKSHDGKVTSGVQKSTSIASRICRKKLKQSLENEEPCLDKSRKNAENARLNRQRKKRYVENLEREIKSLRSSNSALSGERKGLKNQVKQLKSQIDHLKGIIENDSMLSSVLTAVLSVPELKFSKKSLSKTLVSSTPSAERSLPRTDRSGTSSAKEKSETVGGGLCLHVKRDVVSLALCSACNESSQTH